MAYIATFRGKDLRIKVEEPEPGKFRVLLGEQYLEIDVLEPQPNILSMLVDGKSFEVDVDAVGDRFGVMIKGDHYDIEVMEEKRKKLALKMASGASGRQDLKSPMAGNVRKVLVQPGDRVEQGQVLLILEAMKMQNEIKSPIQGLVGSVSAREGVAVAPGDPLCVVEPIEA